MLRDPWWCGGLVPEVDAVDGLIDFPFDVTGIDALDDHPHTLRPRRLLNGPFVIDAERGSSRMAAAHALCGIVGSSRSVPGWLRGT